MMLISVAMLNSTPHTRVACGDASHFGNWLVAVRVLGAPPGGASASGLGLVWLAVNKGVHLLGASDERLVGAKLQDDARETCQQCGRQYQPD